MTTPTTGVNDDGYAEDVPPANDPEVTTEAQSTGGITQGPNGTTTTAEGAMGGALD